ncbi:MAG: hypothetical protein KKB25_01685 [Nanoarchaeota archaeon]|nr:hypothetical protein [Nanoarchaeota archaeon]
MLGVRIGSWDGMSDQDLVLLASENDIADLEKGRIEGELLSDFPYERLNKKISLEVDDKIRTTAWGAAYSKGDSNFGLFLKFYIKSELYDSLKENGSYLDARYDTLGNKINIVNYEKEKEHFRFLIGDLKCFKLL